MEEFNDFYQDTDSEILHWTFDTYQNLSLLPPLCDTANTISIPGESLSDWFGNLKFPPVNYRVNVGNMDDFKHCGLLVKAHVISIAEKFLATRSRCVTVFKTRMESMRYKASGSSEQEALNEIESFSKAMQELANSCARQIQESINSFKQNQGKKKLKGFMNQYTQQEHDEIMKLIFSHPIMRKIPEAAQVELCKKINIDLSQAKLLLKTRRTQIKKYAKSIIERPHWIPDSYSDENVKRFGLGELQSIAPDVFPTAFPVE